MSDIYRIHVGNNEGSTDLIAEFSCGQIAAIQDLAIQIARVAAGAGWKPTITVEPLAQVTEYELDELLGTAEWPVELAQMPSWQVVTQYRHLHVEGKCRKNRFAPQCTAW